MYLIFYDFRWITDLANLKEYNPSKPNPSFNPSFNKNEWKIQCVSKVPQQSEWGDYTSCGVCVCINADLVCRGEQLSYGREQVMFFRRKLGAVILRGNFPKLI